MSIGQPSYLLQKVAPIVLRELQPYIAGKVGPLVAEKIGMPIARKVGLPLAKRIGIPMARKTGTFLLNRVGYPLINKVIFKGNPPSFLLPGNPQANSGTGIKTMVTEAGSGLGPSSGSENGTGTGISTGSGTVINTSKGIKRTKRTETGVGSEAGVRGRKQTKAEKKIEKQNRKRQKTRRGLFSFGKNLQSFPTGIRPLNQIVPGPAVPSPIPEAPSTFVQPLVQNPAVQNSYELFDQNQNYASSLFSRRRQNHGF
ncbi:MAG: hypothetical protein FNP40_06500 [Dehalobacter sp. 4CP]|uniref:hypothetical protein n=1 Tax=Dehalobacter sp. CP TaxID=2594474 RepID=UPI0013C71489|nr:hypothetical protein [Dehalobacter sp. 4CP]